MHIKVKCNDFIEVKDALSILRVNAFIENYQLVAQTLEGNVVIEGEYYPKILIPGDVDETTEFVKKVPFSIVFLEDSLTVEKLDIEDFNYYEIVGRGAEVSFELSIDYFIAPTFFNEIPIQTAREAKAVEDALVVPMNDTKDIDYQISKATNCEIGTTCDKLENEIVDEIHSIDETTYVRVENDSFEEKCFDHDSTELETLDELADVETNRSNKNEELEIDKNTDMTAPTDLYRDNIEKIKEQVTQEIDSLLQTKLEVKENLPTKMNVLGRLRNEKVVISVDYHEEKIIHGYVGASKRE